VTRFHVKGFNDRGSTTTPFDMVLRNGMSRHHICIEALRRSPRTASRATNLIAELEDLITKASAYARAHFEDQPEIANWTWSR